MFIDYLRISVTDRCNLRCLYCMPPEGIETLPQEDILTFEEIERLVKIFVDLGIKRVRLTGGEPLVRKGIVDLVRSLSRIKGIEEVSMTTNGILLSYYARQLKEAGLKRINISLDTLKEDKFERITGSFNLSQVLEGIREAKKAGLSPLKINIVVIKGLNDDEITDFLEFASSWGIILRFIEFMPVSPLWKKDYYISSREVKEICKKKFILEKINQLGFGPAEYYRLNSAIVGFIKTDEGNCRDCNRLRLTSTGDLKICLYEGKGLCLRNFLRAGHSDELIKDIVVKRIGLKENTNYKSWGENKIYMCSIGG